MRPIWVMALLLCAGWALHAQTQNVANSATPVKRLLSARTAYLMASGAKSQPSTTSGQFAENLDSKAPALEELSKAMKKWRRFEIVNDVSKADIVMLTSSEPVPPCLRNNLEGIVANRKFDLYPADRRVGSKFAISRIRNRKDVRAFQARAGK